MKDIGISGDWHLTGLKNQFEFVKKTVDGMPRNLILMGDMIDSGVTRGMNWNQESVDVQLEQFQEIIKNKKILGYVLGNHEYRIVREVGHNIYKPILGDETQSYKINNARIEIEHGSRAPQDQVKQVQDLADIHPEAAVCGLGHTHGLMIDRNWNKQWLVRTGHLQLYPDYARRKIMKPKATGYIRYDTKRNIPYIEVINQ